MDNSKVVALVLGCIAALLVIMAGKSCASDIQEQNKKSSGSSYSSVNPATNAAPRLIEDPPAAVNTPQLIEETDAATTEQQYEEVTDMLGRVVETVPVTQPDAEDIPATDGEPETTLSMLDEFYEQQKQNATNELSGFNHGTPEQQHQKELENATFPSDFNITVN
ncbi:MAG: hypothetical protein IIZ18_06575 [Ruminococcus sp.]|nr:hypothetical protein [Ruminococcus sp.]